MPFRRRTPPKMGGLMPMPKTMERLDRLPSSDLELLLETSLSKTAELFRGLSHQELEPEWLLTEMETNLSQALWVTQILRRRVEI
jgi:hypothetical protein